MSTKDHVNMSLPSRRHVASLLLNTKHLGSLRNTFYLSILSPPVEVILSLPLEMISFDVISLSPFDINFKEGLDKDVISLSLPLEFDVNAFDP